VRNRKRIYADEADIRRLEPEENITEDGAKNAKKSLKLKRDFKHDCAYGSRCD